MSALEGARRMSAAHADPVHDAEVRFVRARAHGANLEVILSSTEMIRKPHSDVEQLLDEQSREWARLMLEEHMALRSALEKPTAVVGADGTPRGSSRDSERHLETLLGRVAVPRRAYQAPGTPDLHPMDAVLNLPRELFSHGIRRMVAKEAARRRTSMRSTSNAPLRAILRATSWCSAPTARAS
jgi:hypothetical protein